MKLLKEEPQINKKRKEKCVKNEMLFYNDIIKLSKNIEMVW